MFSGRARSLLQVQLSSSTSLRAQLPVSSLIRILTRVSFYVVYLAVWSMFKYVLQYLLYLVYYFSTRPVFFELFSYSNLRSTREY